MTSYLQLPLNNQTGIVTESRKELGLKKIFETVAGMLRDSIGDSVLTWLSFGSRKFDRSVTIQYSRP